MRTFSRFSVFSGSALAAAALLTACYNPTYGNNADAGMAFRCFATDNPSCPPGLVCCTGKVCGELLVDLPVEKREGWCVLPPPPEDMTITPVNYWDFGPKPAFYTGPQVDPMLSGIDPATGMSRCHRDDANPNPTDPDVVRALEPNDLPGTAITLSNPLMPDPPPAYMGNPYEICPDRSAPNSADVDVFKFKIAAQANVMIEAKYQVKAGDLDVALFRLAKDSETGMETPQRVQSDLSAVENACIDANRLMAGTYYVVVRGTYSAESRDIYSLNRYSLKVYTTTAAASCAKKDGGI